MQRRVPTVVRPQVKVDTSTQNQESTKMLPFWTLRPCIRPVLNNSTSSDPTQETFLTSKKLVWRSSVRTTRRPDLYLEVSSESLLGVLRLTPALLRLSRTHSKLSSTSFMDLLQHRFQTLSGMSGIKITSWPSK